MTFQNVLRLSLRFSVCVLAFAIIFGFLTETSEGKKVASKKKAETTELDYIIVEAFPPPPVRSVENGPSNKPKSKKSKKNNRNSRQYYPDFYPPAYIEEDNTEVIIDRPSKTGDSCLTPNGEDGTCVAMKKCFHYMYGNDLDGDGIYEGNLELANMIRKSTTGTCKPEGPWKYIDGGIISIDGPETDLVCCTGNLTQSQMTLEDKVVGGRVAKRGQFPYIVAIMNNGRHFCGGSIINSNHVLTAAHCIHHMGSADVGRLTVQVGDHNIYTNRDGYSEVRRVARITKHRFFNPRNLFNDIAILTLAYGVPFNNLVKSVSLGKVGLGFATVAGWGKLSEYGTFPADLHFANVEMWTNPRCQQSYGNFAPGGIADHMVCAGSTRTDACFGDSGGPLILNGRQIGIVSWGIGCGRFPGVYTRVSSFSDWIQRNQNR